MSRYVHEYQTRPIDKWPREFTKNRKRSPFKADYGTTMEGLSRELRHLKASGIAILMALRDDDIRLDGRPRAGASVQHPGVILSFNTPTGPLQFPCDTYTDWLDNLRAIVLTLDSLRRIERYGATRNAEQYTGWKALPAPAADGFANTYDAAKWLCGFMQITLDDIRTKEQVEAQVRAAERMSHPDVGGRSDDFKRVQEARKLLLA